MAWIKGYKRKRPAVLSPGALARHKIAKDAASKRISKEWRLRVLMLLGGRCVHCNNNDSRVMQVDHVEGNGHAERKANRCAASITFAKRIVNNPERYQLLCANCNWIKRHERSEVAWSTSKKLAAQNEEILT